MGEKEGEKKAAAPADGGEKKAAAPADGGEKKAAEGGGKKQGGITVVLKLDLHCEGCAKKVKKAVAHFEGVEKVIADCDANKLTVTGNLDPAWLRERVEYKTKKKVDLISPQPKKEEVKKESEKKDKPVGKPDENKAVADDKKPKEATVIMKIRLHCDGCANKIERLINKNIDGVNKVTTDLSKDLVTVTGTMNVNELTTYLKEKLKRSIEVVPPPKKDEGGGDKKEKEAGGDKKEKEGGGGDKKEKEAGGGDKGEKKEAQSKAVVEGSKVEVNKLEYHGLNPETHYAMPVYNQSYFNQDYGIQPYHHQGFYPNHGYGPYGNTGYVVQYAQGPPPPPPTYVNNMNMNDHMFSDENPNGCSVM